MSKIFAYTRVSTLDQNTSLQEDDIYKKFPDAHMFSEKVSGTSMENRRELELILRVIGRGDKLVVWKLDRLARDLNDLTNIVNELECRGASLEILDQSIDTGTAAGRAFLQMLGVFAEFETNLRRERQAAGIAKAKMDGKYKGRKKLDCRAHIKELLKGGTSLRKTAEKVGCSLSTVQRVKKEEGL